MVYILKGTPFSAKDFVPRKLNCMGQERINACKKIIEGNKAIKNNIDKAKEVRAVIDKENSERDIFIKECIAAKAYLGLK